MATEVVLPMLGITVEKGKITQWHKAEGDTVQKTEIIFTVESKRSPPMWNPPPLESWRKFSSRKGWRFR